MNILFPWKIAEATGWGSYGKGLVLALRRAGHGVVLLDGIASEAGPIHAAPFLLARSVSGPKVMLHPVGNSFGARLASLKDEADFHVALVVAESTTLTPPQVENLQTYDLLLSGCEWFRGVLAGYHLPSIAFPQGVDTLTFSPARQRPPRPANDPFLIFSGGKFEYRKGHDLVIETFKQLRRRFPEIPARLVCAWHNFWPDTVGPLQFTGHLTSLPAFSTESGQWNFPAWLPTQGIRPEDAICLPPLLPEQMAAVIRECDAGLFLSRAEGNVNMSLAECAATGIPCVVSGNTGHLSYLTEPLITLASTWPTHRVPHGYTGAEGWGEVKPEECAAMLAMIAKDGPASASRRGIVTADIDGYRECDLYMPDGGLPAFEATDFASRWSWDVRASALVTLIQERSSFPNRGY